MRSPPPPLPTRRADRASWGRWPAAMVYARCLTAGARTYCPEVFCGTAIYTPDELDPSAAVSVDSEGNVVVDVPEEPKPPKKSKAAAKAEAEEVADAEVEEKSSAEDRLAYLTTLVKETGVDADFLKQHCKASRKEEWLADPSKIETAIHLLELRLKATPSSETVAAAK